MSSLILALKYWVLIVENDLKSGVDRLAESIHYDCLWKSIEGEFVRFKTKKVLDAYSDQRAVKPNRTL